MMLKFKSAKAKWGKLKIDLFLHKQFEQQRLIQNFWLEANLLEYLT